MVTDDQNVCSVTCQVSGRAFILLMFSMGSFPHGHVKLILQIVQVTLTSPLSCVHFCDTKANDACIYTERKEHFSPRLTAEKFVIFASRPPKHLSLRSPSGVWTSEFSVPYLRFVVSLDEVILYHGYTLLISPPVSSSSHFLSLCVCERRLPRQPSTRMKRDTFHSGALL